MTVHRGARAARSLAAKRRRPHLRQLLSFAAVALLLLAVQMTHAGPVAAAVVTPFAFRFTTNANGDIAIVGNVVTTCPTTGDVTSPACVSALARIGADPDLNNNAYPMVFVDVDTLDTPTGVSPNNSSSATFTLPSGARGADVLFAGLYWGGRYSTSYASAVAGRTSVRFRPPGVGASYQTLTGTVIGVQDFGSAASFSAYQSFANVTAQVQAAGSGSYTVGGIFADAVSNTFGGWSLVVAYRQPGAPPRNLSVFDGFATIASPLADQSVDVTISGFLAPPSGSVNARVGIVAYEGDAGSLGDDMQMKSGTDVGVAGDYATLTDAVRPIGNFFNSGISRLGVRISDKTPDFDNQLGFDAAVVAANGIIANGATGARLRFTTSAEAYFPGVLTTAIDINEPNIQLTKSADALSGLPLREGDVIEYTVTATNTGFEDARAVEITDTLALGTTFVPGSLVIVSGPSAGPQTDIPSDDRAQVSGRDVIFDVGLDPNTTVGRILHVSPLSDSTSTIRFRATVDASFLATYGESDVVNLARVAYVGATSANEFQVASNVTLLPVRVRPNLSISKVRLDPLRIGSAVRYILHVENGASAGVTTGPVTVTDTLPTGIAYVSAIGTDWACSAIGQTVSCVLSQTGFVAGAILPEITVTGLGTAGVVFPAVNTATLSTTADNTSGNNSASETATGQPDLAITKSHSGAFTPGQSATYSIVAPRAASPVIRVVALAIPAAQEAEVASPLPAGTGVSFRLVVRLDAGARAGSVVTAAARVSGVPQDAVAVNNSAGTTRSVAGPRALPGLPNTGRPGARTRPLGSAVLLLLGAGGLSLLAWRLRRVGAR